MPDEHERAQGGHFPEEVHPRQVVGQHQAVHGAQEEQHEKEEPRLAALGEVQVFLVFLHVAEAVETDEAPHDGDDQHHGQRQAVGVEAGDLRPVVHQEEVQIDHAEHLQRREPHDEQVAHAQRDEEDEPEQGEIKNGDQAVEADAKNGLGRVGERAEARQSHRRRGGYRHRYRDDDVARGVAPDEIDRQGS